MEFEQILLNAVQDGIRKGIQDRLGHSYSSPLNGLLNDAVKEFAEQFRVLMNEAITSAVRDGAFREQIKTQIRHKLATVLVARFGGELERQVNILKSDPATRARITLAIEEIVKERAAVT